MAEHTGGPVLIVGLGRSGQAAARLLLHRGVSVMAVDSNATLLTRHPEIQRLKAEGLEVLHESAVTDLNGFAYLVSSPGIPSDHPLFSLATERGLEVIGEVELACRSLTGQRVLAVTGTNGKTSVTLLVTHVLNQSGCPAKAVGNVGLALCGEVDKGLGDEVLVLELSSYQLESLHARVLDAGVVLNITPDHLDRHGDMETYAKAKLSMSRCIKPGGLFLVQQQIVQQFPHLFEPLCYQTLDVGADHHAENQQAAWKLCETMGLHPEQFEKALKTFKKPPHRIQFVRQYAGVNYFDDSKGTNIDAVMKAVASIEGPIILIAGGVHKGASYVPWIPLFRGKVRRIYAIGQAAPVIQQELGQCIPVEVVASLEWAIKGAARQAFQGESVLLSPGCASFDMFRDYTQRGEEFQKIVWGLSDGEGQ